MTAKLNYFPIDMSAGQSWSTLNNRNLKVTVGGGYGGTVNVYNLFLDVEYKPVEFRVGDNLTAVAIAGVETDGDGTGTLIENPADVIESLLTTFLGFSSSEIDAASFLETKNALANWRFAFRLGEATDSAQLLAQLAQQARCWLWAEAGVYTLKYRPSFLQAANHEISSTGVTGYIEGTNRIVPLGWDHIWNRIVVRYYQDYAPWGDHDYRRVKVAEDLTSQSTYGVRELLVEGFAIRSDDTAHNLAQFLLAQYSRPRYMYQYESHLGGLRIERGDVLAITDADWSLSAAKAQVVAVYYQPGMVTRDSVEADRMQVRALLDPYWYHWSESGANQWAPGEAGIVIVGASDDGYDTAGVIVAAEDAAGNMRAAVRIPSSGDLLLRGHIATRQSLPAAAENPVTWNNSRERIQFALDDNTTVMEIDRDGNIYIPGQYAGLQTLTFSGTQSAIESDGSSLWWNLGSTRVLEVTAAGHLKVSGRVGRYASDIRLF